MSGKRYTEEFKAEAASRCLSKGATREGAMRLAVSPDASYGWVRERRKAPEVLVAEAGQAAEVRRL